MKLPFQMGDFVPSELMLANLKIREQGEEIERLRQAIEGGHDRAEIARVENKRLRTALEIVARGDDGMDSYTALGMQDIARKALEHCDDIMDCPGCGGTGKIEAAECEECNGHGKVTL